MADLEKVSAQIEGIEARICKALDAGEKVLEFDKQLREAREEQAVALKAAHDAGAKISEELSKRIEAQERRLGALSATGVASAEPAEPVAKSFGAQVTDWIGSDPNLHARAKGGRGTGRLELTGRTVRQHVAMVEAVKALGLHATDENISMVQKTMLLSDNSSIIPIQRLPNVYPMHGRRSVVSDLIPSQPVSGGRIDYMEYMGLAPGTYLTATSVSSSGTTATLTYTAHGARVGDRIHVKDSSDTDYNGYFVVASVPTADTLTYVMAADPGDDTADGTILWANLSLWGAAATVAENALKPESTLTTRTLPAYIELVAHLFRISKQMLDDVPGLQSEINGAGIRGLQELKEYKLLYGDGSGETIDGFMHKAGVQAYTQTVAGDIGRMRAYRHLVTLLENVGATPTAAIANPDDWELFETSVGLDDHFLLQGGAAGSQQSLFRVPITTTRWIEPGKILMGDFSEGAKLLQREGAQVSFADQDGDDFKYNRLAMRFEERLGLAIQRPEFFCKLTLI